MKALAFTLLFLALLAVGCAKSPESPAAATISRALMAQCPLSFREVLSNGALATQAFVRPEHVARLDASSQAESTLLVTLTAEGEDHMRRHTESHVGGSIATFCGETEVSRATINAPFGNRFEVAVPRPSDA